MLFYFTYSTINNDDILINFYLPKIYFLNCTGKDIFLKKNIQQITCLCEKSTGKVKRIRIKKSSFQQKQGQLVY